MNGVGWKEGQYCLLFEHQSDVAQKVELLRNKHAETFNHCVRVALLGEKLGRVLQLDWDLKLKLVRGCLIHDLGKLKIPNEILDCEAPLTKEQWMIVKCHSQFGVDLLGSRAELEEEIFDVILHHHERWDGKGYPHGLKGEAIPLLARLCAVADAFDSMMSERAYRPRKTAAEAMRELERHAGTQFDPQIVEHFISMADEVSRMYFSERMLRQRGNCRGGEGRP